ncbi:MAG: ABC transporter ATP-binding protein [Acholeplasmatales bacterium]|jgi:spermidine/putrescine transport system ATP-binding protein|nr:ABC transporter ATP-binding protein [Acholeplasmatales bacterium]
MEKKVIIKLENIVKNYGQFAAVHNISLDIYENEFITLLGPSGCGKTTTLRLIGGFEKLDEGNIIIDDKIINDIPPYARPINTVFQRYALFEHLNVIKNVTFGLDNRPRKYLIKFFHLEEVESKLLSKTIKAKIEEAALAALELVGLAGFETRSCNKLSGGQMQRVALARAIINKPRILLLDEPLSALDLKLRQNMQYELKQMQKTLGITFIFVTHDQEEAMTMSDRIVVMNKGLIIQEGTPKRIYNEPINRYVATFVGESNIIGGHYVKKDLVNFFGKDFACVGYTFKANEPVDVVIRPEDWDVVSLKKAQLVGIVTNTVFKGVYNELTVDLNGVELMVNTYEFYNIGDKIGLHVDPYEIHLMKIDEANYAQEINPDEHQVLDNE